MNRPLLITDCDEVLLHMIGHFAEWIEEAHGYRFVLEEPGFTNAVRYIDSGEPVPAEKIWPLLDLFFDSEMDRQKIVPGAAEALRAMGETADIVILTNIGDEYQASRVEQLKAVGISHRVLCNHGGKGPPVLELIEQMRPSAVVFVDDLPIHHESVAKHAPEVWRLHMIAEPRVAAHIPPSPHAHARIDDWDRAVPWILSRFAAGQAPQEAAKEVT
jgi:hypothetical protein